jgi:hypothetical protein
MYADPAHIRKNRVNLSLNDAEDRLADAMAEFNGMQKSAFLRVLVLEGLSRFHSQDSGLPAPEMRAANQ